MECLTAIALNVVLAVIFAAVTGVVGAAAYDRFRRQERGE